MPAERYTLDGGPEVEARIAAILQEASDAVRPVVPPDRLRSLVLLGGYGRGEGGVEVRDGLEHPHNNLDLLAVTRGPAPRSLKARLDEALAPVIERHGIGIDVGTIADRTLAQAPCLVMWYDLRHGHRTLLGDADFVPSLDRFRVDRIAPDDVRDLLVNRGTLLVINDALIARGTLDPEGRRVVVRHAMKAVIGYGDAWLFSRGAYHWSYAERRRRMAARPDAPDALRTLYDRAMAFRFRPEYAPFEGLDLLGWCSGLKEALAPVHLAVEANRLGRPRLTWADHPRASLFAALGSGLTDWRALARKARALLSGDASAGGPWTARLAWRFAPPRERLAVLFPAVAYGLRDAPARDLARSVLGADPLPQPHRARLAFLAWWGRHGDPNFAAAARRLGLSLSEPGGPA